MLDRFSKWLMRVSWMSSGKWLRVAECHLAHVILGQVFGRVRLILLVLLLVYGLRSVNIHTYGERSLIVGPIAKLSGRMDDINYTATLKFLLMSLL